MVSGVWANEFDGGLAGEFEFAFEDHLAIGVFFSDVVGFFVHVVPF